MINIHGHMSLQEEDPVAAGWGVRRTEQTERLRCAPSPQTQPVSLRSRNPASRPGHTRPATPATDLLRSE